MEEVFKNKSKFLIRQLATLGVMRIRMEVKEQILLQKTINLDRFIRLASLHHLKGSPEMAYAKKFIDMISAGSGNSHNLDSKSKNFFEFDPDSEITGGLN